MTMKKIFSIAAVFMLIVMTSCQKTVVQTDTQVGISKITYYATITMNGDVYMATPLGTPFVDPGATAATSAGTSVPVVVQGSVDETTAGIYTLNYVATNADGFSVTTARHIAVYDTDAGAAANDLSGSYARSTNGSLAVWTKIAPGVYEVVNPGGAPTDPTFTVMVLNPTGFDISMPQQQSSNGSTVTASGALYDGIDVPASYQWEIVNAGYGTSTRVFTKQ